MIKNFMMLLSLSLVFYSCTKPCDDTNCFNNGVCVDGDCLCPDGFYGVNCELEIEDNIIDNENYNVCDSDVINYNGYTYDLVEVGNRCWFKENLRSERFNNGDAIQEEVNLFEWSPTNDYPMFIDSWSYTPLQGQNGSLYNGNVIIDNRNVCPVGWHVSTDEDWMELESIIGMSDDDINSTSSHRGVGFRNLLVDESIFASFPTHLPSIEAFRFHSVAFYNLHYAWC